MRPFSKEVFFVFLGLTGCFIFFEINYFIAVHQVFLSETRYVSQQIHVPFVLAFYVLKFFCAQLLLHLIYVLFLWLLFGLIAAAFPVFQKYAFSFIFLLWSGSVVSILIFNQIFFPYSKFAILTDSFFPNYIDRMIFSIALVICAFILIWSFVRIVKRASKELLKPFILMASLIFFSCLFFYLIYVNISKIFLNHSNNMNSAEYPNILIIGIDSLRPDFLSYSNGPVKTPFLDSQLKQSVVFQNAFTPLARTFPSWVGILTGQYPFRHGVRFNLAKQDELNLEDTIPRRLQALGYRTVFATDETRFSNIGHRFGFAEVYTPPVGITDFLLGSFNDFPLSNLFVNSFLGRYLFPESYGNRPVYFTYEPQTFLDLIKPIWEKQSDKPLFLAIHFCLPHYPYLWTKSLPGDATPLLKYQASLAAVDHQLQIFFSELEKTHYLKNTIIIFLSDHGEALELPGDRITNKNLYQGLHLNDQPKQFYPANLDHEDFNQSAGHGTDVLGLSQYKVLLAVRSLGDKIKILPSDIDDFASLLDIKPTLFHYLKIQPNQIVDGIDLGAWIFQSGNLPFPNRYLFLESDYSPAAIRSVYPHVNEAIAEGIKFFQVEPGTLNLIVRPDMARMVIASKQFALLNQNWMLAIYPHEQPGGLCYWPVLVNLQSGEWTDRMNSSLGIKGNMALLQSHLMSVYFPRAAFTPKNCL